MSHSPEPWSARDTCDSEGWPLIQIFYNHSTEPLATVLTDLDDADRIVACVNAMKDVPDPAAFVEYVKAFISRHYMTESTYKLVGSDVNEIAIELAKYIDMELPT